MIARVFELIFSSSRRTSRLQVSGSMSAKTGVAPTRTTTSAVAAKVKAGVITSSPGPMPRAIRLISRASVPLATEMQ